MTIIPTLEWVETTELSMAIREGALYYPILGGFHLLAIALFGGMLLMTDLRILGLAMARTQISELVRQFRLWKQIGFAVVVSSGLLLMWAEPLKLYRSREFWIKMILFALVGVHAWIFRPGVYQHPEKLDAMVTRQAKVAAVLSLLLWAGLIISGRMIAFDE